VPAEYLQRPGRPTIEVYAVAGRGVAAQMGFSDESRERLMTALGVPVDYRLTEDDSGLALRVDGAPVERVESAPVLGRINRAMVQGDRVVVQGFAVDRARKESPVEFYVFVGSDLLHAG